MIRKWWKKGILFLAIGLLTAELLLQIAHLGVSWHRDRRWREQLSAAQKSKIVVLCVGESTTEWGGDDSYPSRLEARLKELIPEKSVSVVNGGRAASNSGELHSMLPGLLEKTKPNFVVFMMGINDPLYLTAPGFEWWERIRPWMQWSRVWKLAELLRVNLGVISVANAEDPENKHPNRQVIKKEPPAGSIVDFSLLEQGMRELKAPDGWEKAKKTFGKFLATNRLAYHHYLVADVYFWVGGRGKHREEALKYLEIAYALDPSHYATQWLLIIHLSEFPETRERAKRIAQSAISHGNVNSDIYLSLITLYREDGKHAEADKLLVESLEKSRGDTRLFLFSSALDSCELKNSPFREKDCARWWRNSLEEFPGNPRLLSRAPASERAYAKWRLLRDVRNYHLHPNTVSHYRAMVEESQKAGAQVISMQYPTMEVAPLENILKDIDGLVFVENLTTFNTHLAKHPYSSLFVDKFTSSFGHTNRAGSDMIARKLADKIVSME